MTQHDLLENPKHRHNSAQTSNLAVQLVIKECESDYTNKEKYFFSE